MFKKWNIRNAVMKPCINITTKTIKINPNQLTLMNKSTKQPIVINIFLINLSFFNIISAHT